MTSPPSRRVPVSALLYALVVVGGGSLCAQQAELTADRIYDPTHLVDVKIEIAAADWDVLRHQARSFVIALGKGPAKRPYTYYKGIVTIDGVRIYFANGDIAHIRPSGNAPQLRLYACADTQARADEIVATGIREPDGILRRLEAIVRT